MGLPRQDAGLRFRSDRVMTMAAGKVLIFGASGHIGGPVARFMRYKGWRERLRLATSSAAKLDRLRVSFPDCETVVADYLNLDSLNDALKGVRTVFVITPDFIDEPVAMSNLKQERKSTRLNSSH